MCFIVLKSEGEKAFCSGASFDELLQVENEEQGIEFFSGFAAFAKCYAQLQQAYNWARSRKAVGGGVGIIAACDYVFATSKRY
jgi:methylglutaconyl-CoA hydratase